MENVLSLTSVYKTFEVGMVHRQVLRVLNDVSFDVRKGEVLSLVGESGSGKTTAAKMISRIHSEDSGTITFMGGAVKRNLSGSELRLHRKKVQLIFQDPFSSLNPTKRVVQCAGRPLSIHFGLRGGELRSKVQETLEMVGLKPADRFMMKFPHELSGGERQRVNIARALAVRPSLLLADEPTSMLDVSVRLGIMNLFADLKAEGLSCLYITHDLSGARYLSDRIAIMYTGFIMEIGDTDEVVKNPLHPYTRLLKRAAPQPQAHAAHEKLAARGEIPSLADMPSGCTFHPRCPLADKRCASEVPPLRAVGGRMVRCFKA